MKRREFMQTTSAAALAAALPQAIQAIETTPACCDRTYASPAAAINSPRETLLYVPAICVGTPRPQRPDYLATIDVDPASDSFGQVISRLNMPHVGDELHHFGWNACSSCHGHSDRFRRFIVLPGLASGRIHIIDTEDACTPQLYQVIEADEIARKTNLSTPHTVHCLATGEIMISMLGDASGERPGGFLLLDDDFEVQGRWEHDAAGMQFNYDFWYQPRHNVMVSSEWAAPKTVAQGFKLEDVQAGRYGQRLHFWDWQQRKVEQTVDLGETGLIPLEVRFHHDPDSTHGFVGAALSSTIWHWQKVGDQWQVQPRISVKSVKTVGWPFPVPGLITDLVLSMDDKWLYFSNWLHGDIRQYDISDPAQPRLAGRAWLGGVIGHATDVPDRQINGGPQMLQLSLDGKRLYVTNSLYSPWDDQFYPEMASEGSYLIQLDCDTEKGGLSVNHDLFVDFGAEPGGPARAHEMRFPGGDCTSDIWG